MSKFALVHIDTVKGGREFFKLEKDGVSEFDVFETEARCQYDSEMNSIYHRMVLVARGEQMPKTQYRQLKDGLKNVTEFEIKTKHLRVYCIIDVNSGNLVITGGHKTDQKRDIRHFRNIAAEYLESKGAIK